MDAKGKIIKEAIQLFAEQGYSGTSVRQIVDAAGVNVSLVSYHFGGKEGLYEECIKLFGLSNQAMVKQVLTKATSIHDFHAKLSLFVRGFLDAIVQNDSFQKIVMRELDANSEVFKKLLSEVFLETFTVIAQFLAAGKDDGYLRPEVDPMELTNLLQGAIHQQVRVDGIRQDWRQETIHDQDVRAKVADQIIAIYFTGALQLDKFIGRQETNVKT